MTPEAGWLPAVTKRCRVCLRDLGLDQFYIRATSADGRRAECKDCHKARKAKYRAENPEKVRTAHAKYYANNTQQRNEDSARRYAQNPEKANACSAEWRREHPEQVKANSARYIAENPEKIRAASARWNAEHVESVTERGRRRRAIKAGAFIGPVPDDIVAQLVAIYGPTCMAPGCESVKLSIDHIMPLSKGGAHVVSNLQLLCKSCNSRKGNWSYADYRPDLRGAAS